MQQSLALFWKNLCLFLYCFLSISTFNTLNIFKMRLEYRKAWFPPMRLTYSQVYSYENKYNPIGSSNLKKNNLTTFREIIRLFS